MGNADSTDVGRLLREWRAGNQSSLDQLMPVVYEELHAIARRQLRGERSGVTLQTTALLHEAYLRLAASDVPWEDRRHFFAVAARTMRRVLVDHARARGRVKRGGGVRMVTLDSQLAPAADATVDIAALDEALERLSSLDERKARIVELHYFGGLSYDETAEALAISPATVHRELRLAKAWLFRELGEASGQTEH